MQNQYKRSVYVLRLITVLAFFCVLCFPMAMMLLDGPDQTPVENEAVTEPVRLDYESYFSGEFHQAFSDWFSHHYPMRSNIVTLFRNMLYRYEASGPAVALMQALTGFAYADGEQEGASWEPTAPETEVVDPTDFYIHPDNVYAQVNQALLAEQLQEPVGFKGSNGIVVGKSGYLFQDEYINEYYGYTATYAAISQQGIARTVEELSYIQKALWERYGITMVYVISPNKVSMYERCVPEYYRHAFLPAEDYVRPVDMLRDALKDSDVLYLDSAELYRSIGLLNTFTKTGTHWNHLASFETTAEILRLYDDFGATPVKLMKINRVLSQADPVSDGEHTSNDADIFHILYDDMGSVPNQIMDEAYYFPEVTVQNPDAKPIRILLQGGSFATDIDYYLRTYGIGDVRYIHYNGIRHRNTWEGEDPWSRGIAIWDKILTGLDLLIFEVNENYIRSEHCSGTNWEGECGDHNIGSNATYDSLYAFLKSTE